MRFVFPRSLRAHETKGAGRFCTLNARFVTFIPFYAFSRACGGLGQSEREVVEGFSKRLINKLLHEPTSQLKKSVGNGKGEVFLEAVKYLHKIEGITSREVQDPESELDQAD